MQRHIIQPRKNWERKIEEVGLIYHSIDSTPYWDESVYYAFTLAQIEELERATAELYDMCLQVGEHIITKRRYSELGIPSSAIEAIEWSWNNSTPSIYGRFDLVYDGKGPPKLLEFNADTPTSLLEASVVQWYWLKDTFPHLDQFNSLHEKLIDQWRAIKPYLRGSQLYFGHVDDYEDLMTVSYLRDTAQQAGIATSATLIDDIGWNEKPPHFRDLDDRGIVSLFKLYPWEWLLQENGSSTLKVYQQIDWIEPIWRMLWSNKGILALLWELFPGHPYLLETYRDSPRNLRDYVKKPLLSREGANIEIHAGGKTLANDGPYGDEGYVYQQLASLSSFDGSYPIIGSWYVTDQGPGGIGIRESDSRITDNRSRFVCHVITE